jgi:hypothetical protein
MREISGVERLDTRQGFAAVGDEQRDRCAHSSEIQRRQQEQEAERERQRKAGPPKRELLATAHAALAEADGKVADLKVAVVRTSKIVAGIEASKAEIENALQEVDGKQTARLVESFAGGCEAPPPCSRTAALRSSLHQAEAALTPSVRALRWLEADLDKARNEVTRCAYAVRVVAVDVLIDDAVVEAEAITAADSELRRRRIDLDQLAVTLTIERRRLFTAPPALPAVIRRALSPEPVRLGTAQAEAPDWAAQLEKLCRDPTAAEARSG